MLRRSWFWMLVAGFTVLFSVISAAAASASIIWGD
jgi:hypothetical protein